MNQQHIKDNWKEYETKIVKPVWNHHKTTYERLGIEYGDFIGISYEILTKDLHKYSSSKSGISTFGIRVLKTRMADYIRNNYQTDKTRANFCPQSLNVPVAEDSEIEVWETIIDQESGCQSENNVEKIKCFLKTLSNQQKEILLLSAIGLDKDEIQDVMEISRESYDENMKKIKSPRRISKLRNGGKKYGKKARNM